MRAKRWISAPAGVLVLACVVAACGDEEGLTPAEADAIVDLVGGTASGALLGETLGSSGRARLGIVRPADGNWSASSWDFDYDVTVPCPDGGSVAVSGTGELRTTEGGAEYELEGTNEFADCSYEGGGVSLTLVSGVVAQRFLMVVESSDDLTNFGATGEGDWSGDVNVETGSGYSGDCRLQLSFRLSVDVNLAGGTASVNVEGVVTGTVCDEQVEVDVTESLWFGI